MKELVRLINAFDSYENEGESLTAEAFCRRYLADLEVSKEHPQCEEGVIPIEARLAKAVGRLSRFSQIYSKKVLLTLEMKNIDDFVYIGTIGQMINPKKIEVIQAHMTEVTTGTAIIARLVDAGWVIEEPDPSDARSKRLSLTKKGHELWNRAYPEMRKVARTTFDALTEAEAEIFLSIAEKLDRIHTGMYADCKNLDVEEIYEKMYGRSIPESFSVSRD